MAGEESQPISGGARRRISRKGYTRKSYIRKSGTRVKSARVKSGLIKDRGLPGKGPKILPGPQKGALEGYTTNQPTKSRRDKLIKLAKKKSYATVVRDLNLRANFSKRTAPKASQTMRADMKFLKDNRNKI